MGQFFKYLIQLILSPSEGWADISDEKPNPGKLLHKGFLPLLAICFISVFVPYFTGLNPNLVELIIDAFSQAGIYFISIFIARLILVLYLPRLDSQVSGDNIYTLVVCAAGLMVTVQIVTNLLPWNILFFKFMPLYVMLVLYKSTAYMQVPENNHINYLILTSAACVITPLLLYYLLIFII